MSIGPKSQLREEFKVGITKKVEYVVKKSFEAFRVDPLGYTFDIAYILAMISLFFNKKLPFEFYLLLAVLGVIQVYKFMDSKEKIEILPVKEKK